MSPAALTSVAMTSAGVITASVNTANSATILTFGTLGSATITALTPSWYSSTVLQLNFTGTVGGTASAQPAGTITPTALFRDSAGNANATAASGSQDVL